MFALTRPCAVALLLIPWIGAPAAGPLTLAEAERLALDYDAGVRAAQAQTRALQEQAVADGQLPDPQLSLGAMSLPADSFSRTAEPMTQMTVGVSQAIPPGATLRHRVARGRYQAGAAEAAAALRERELLRDVRSAYLELGYQEAALGVIGETRELFADIVAVTQSLYRTGRNNLQDVLAAQLELSLLDDRGYALHAERDAARAELQRWIGPLAGDLSLPTTLPGLPDPPDPEVLQAGLEGHPLIAQASAQVAAGQSAVEIARQQYKPGWMLNLTYGQRSGREPDGMERPDLVSAMVTMDLPLFAGKRQDRRVAASIEETAGLRYQRDDVYRMLQRELEADYARWRRYHEREQGYADNILPAARNNAESALSAYRNNVTDFTTLTRAQTSALDSSLQALRTQVDRLLVQARLLYLAGETP
jgi:outer membrane protein TolC